jgi:hypothetical protein
MGEENKIHAQLGGDGLMVEGSQGQKMLHWSEIRITGLRSKSVHRRKEDI